MIIQTFDNGWDNHYPLKQFEQQVLNDMLIKIKDDDSRTVIINSVWYTERFHQAVMSWLRQNDFDHIVLVAMLDAAIPYPDRYAEFKRPVSTVGYYDGPGHVDFCALFVDKFLKVPDTKDLLSTDQMHIPFMCLNRKPHWHRRQLYQRLQELKLVHRGLVSMGGDNGVAVRKLSTDTTNDDLAPNATADHFGIPNDIVSLGHLSNWQKCFLNVVTETFYDINNSGFVSEKIYKPIVGCRPFLVYDPDGAIQWLTQRGFQSYVNDFKDISDLDLTIPSNIAPFLGILCNQPSSYHNKKFIDLHDKLLYNKDHFRNHITLQKNTVQQGITCPI